MLQKLLSAPLYNAVVDTACGLRINEIRLRIGKACTMTIDGCRRASDYIVTRADIDYTVGVASGFSVYAVNDLLVSGYLRYEGGIRLGVVGEGVTDGARLTTIKHISGLVLRVPHQIKGCARQLFSKILGKEGLKNTIVISPPSAGKTTLLRDLARLSSESGIETLIVDERYEIAGAYEGVPTLDVGAHTDVISGVSKHIAYENCVRSMSPELLITDELFTQRDVEVVCDCARCGVTVFASIHAEDISVLNGQVFSPLKRILGCTAVLTKTPRCGTLREIKLW